MSEQDVASLEELINSLPEPDPRLVEISLSPKINEYFEENMRDIRRKKKERDRLNFEYKSINLYKEFRSPVKLMYWIVIEGLRLIGDIIMYDLIEVADKFYINKNGELSHVGWIKFVYRIVGKPRKRTQRTEYFDLGEPETLKKLISGSGLNVLEEVTITEEGEEIRKYHIFDDNALEEIVTKLYKLVNEGKLVVPENTVMIFRKEDPRYSSTEAVKRAKELLGISTTE